MGWETPLGEDPLCRMYESLIQSSIALDFKQCLSHVLLNEPTGTYHIPTISPSLEVFISTSTDWSLPYPDHFTLSRSFYIYFHRLELTISRLFHPLSKFVYLLPPTGAYHIPTISPSLEVCISTSTDWSLPYPHHFTLSRSLYIYFHRLELTISRPFHPLSKFYIYFHRLELTISRPFHPLSKFVYLLPPTGAYHIPTISPSLEVFISTSTDWSLPYPDHFTLSRSLYIYFHRLELTISRPFHPLSKFVYLLPPTGTYHIPTISSSLEVCISTSTDWSLPYPDHFTLSRSLYIYFHRLELTISRPFHPLSKFVYLLPPTGAYHIPTISPSLEVCISTSTDWSSPYPDHFTLSRSLYIYFQTECGIFGRRTVVSAITRRLVD